MEKHRPGNLRNIDAAGVRAFGCSERPVCRPDGRQESVPLWRRGSCSHEFSFRHGELCRLQPRGMGRCRSCAARRDPGSSQIRFIRRNDSYLNGHRMGSERVFPIFWRTFDCEGKRAMVPRSRTRNVRRNFRRADSYGAAACVSGRAAHPPRAAVAIRLLDTRCMRVGAVRDQLFLHVQFSERCRIGGLQHR